MNKHEIASHTRKHHSLTLADTISISTCSKMWSNWGILSLMWISRVSTEAFDIEWLRFVFLRSISTSSKPTPLGTGTASRPFFTEVIWLEEWAADRGGGLSLGNLGDSSLLKCTLSSEWVLAAGEDGGGGAFRFDVCLRGLLLEPIQWRAHNVIFLRTESLSQNRNSHSGSAEWDGETGGTGAARLLWDREEWRLDFCSSTTRILWFFSFL